MFSFQTTVKLHNTDSAGLLFFAHQFKMAHDAYESWLDSIGLGFAKLFAERDFLLPIVHAEADFKTALAVGDRLTIELSVEEIGNSSFTLAYDIRTADDVVAGTAKTVHVCLDKVNRGSMPLPDDLRDALSQL